MDFGFERTACSCQYCQEPCRYMSGYLAPGDIPRMMAFLGEQDPQEFARMHLMASPGPIVAKGGVIFRISTLVPARNPDGSCVFFRDDRCAIWPAAPFGCSHFDMHQPKDQADRRSATALRAILLANRSGGLYHRLWVLLAYEGRTTFGPEEARTRFDRGVQPRPNKV